MPFLTSGTGGRADDAVDGRVAGAHDGERVGCGPLMPRVVSVPGSELMVAPPVPRVIVPDQVLALARLRRAPLAPTPMPTRLVIGSAIVRPEPSISIVAPVATVVPPAVVPSARRGLDPDDAGADRRHARVRVGVRQRERAGTGLDQGAGTGGDGAADRRVAHAADREGQVRRR